MPDDLGTDPPSEIYKRWLESLRQRDPLLHRILMARIPQIAQEIQAKILPQTANVAAGGIVHESASNDRIEQLVFETIVREGRPALLIQNDTIAFGGTQDDAASKPIVDVLLGAARVLQPLFPLVGRIDAPNNSGGLPFLGTGWLVDRNIVVTNRHVAELMARSDGQTFEFKPGRFGESLQVMLDYRHEHDLTRTAIAKIRRVLWIEPDAMKADIAFLEVEAADDGLDRGWIPLAEQDAQDAARVAVIGYPAKAPAYLIPDQSWMDRIYGATYEIKRVAPGLMGNASRGWATHDCTTLGGNSGSVVVSTDRAEAVALHFAGLYMVENYAVPASTIRRYLATRPWHPCAPPSPPVSEAGSPTPPPTPARPAPTQGEAAGPGTLTSTRGVKRTLSLSIPIRIEVSVGQPTADDVAAGVVTGAVTTTAAMTKGPDAAAAELARELAGMPGVLAVRAAGLTEAGRITSTIGIFVAAHPERLRFVRSSLPDSYHGYRVVVRPASIRDQLGMADNGAVMEAVSVIAYDDAARTGDGYSFDWVSGAMALVLHVGPERSWSELRNFLAQADQRLVSSMYQFHAKHIGEAVGERLAAHTDMKLVLAQQTRNTAGKVAEGDFDRAAEFARWRQSYPQTFENVYVPIGASGLVANSYHIKVTVANQSDVWLSSGNWTRASQPLIDEAHLNDPAATSRAGNREWHVILRNETLADRFRNHILADMRRSEVLGGTLEAVGGETLIDVPVTVLEGLAPEAVPRAVFEPLRIPSRTVRVKPLLTPDQKGSVYTDAVLALIESAEDQLVLQNQYIKFASVTKGNLKRLVDAVCAKAKVIRDCRVLLRSGGDGFWDDMQALQRNGLDVHRCVRRIANTHTKGIVVDGRQALVGSHNWSSDGVSLNRDASLIFDDREVAQYFLRVFDEDWDRTVPLQAREPEVESAPRVASGAQAPPGFVRMTLSEFVDR
jgi:V8-like Glu-specific endopeptidase